MTCKTCHGSEKIHHTTGGYYDPGEWTETCICRRSGSPAWWSKGHVLRAAHQPMIMWDGDMYAAPLPIPYFPDQRWWSSRRVELAWFIWELKTITDSEACRFDLQRFMTHYFPDRFHLAFTTEHVQAIEGMQRVIIEGGNYAQRLKRGMGATSMMEAATTWALAFNHRQFPVVVGSDKYHAEQLTRGIFNEHECNRRLTRDFSHLPGCPIRPIGITGSMKGLAEYDNDGIRIRPDMAIIDTPHTDRSSKSPAEVQRRADIIARTIPGLSGPSVAMATVFLDSVEVAQ